MDTRKQTIEKFYSAFSELDFATMQSCYHSEAVFNDPVFGLLDATEAKAMWEMLCMRAKDFSITYNNIQLLDEEYTTCNWVATYLLSKNGSLSIKELSDQTEVSHPAASQLITNLKNKKLVATTTCTDDGRRQLVQLTEKGQQLLRQVLPVWDAVTLAMQQLAAGEPGCHDILPAITALEDTFRSVNLSGMIHENLAVILKTEAI